MACSSSTKTARLRFRIEAFEAYLDVGRENFVGQADEKLVESSLFDAETSERVVESITSLSESQEGERHFTLETATGETGIVNVRLTTHTLDD